MESTTCTTPHLLEVAEALVLPAHDGRHPPERRALQLLAPVERVAELEEPDVVLGDGVDEVPRGVDLAQRQLVVVLGGQVRVWWEGGQFRQLWSHVWPELSKNLVTMGQIPTILQAGLIWHAQRNQLGRSPRGRYQGAGGPGARGHGPGARGP